MPCFETPFAADLPTFDTPFEVAPTETALADSNGSKGKNIVKKEIRCMRDMDKKQRKGMVPKNLP